MIDDISLEFEEALSIRKNLNTVLWKDYNKLQKVFTKIFNEEDKGVLKKISDMNYYQGGYPTENSKPKIEVLFRDVAAIVKYFYVMGRID